MAKRLSLLLFLATLVAQSGCVTAIYGVQPNTDRLAQLVPGESRSSDVLLALGEPRGKGAAHLSPELPLRNVWYYEYVKGSGAMTMTVNLKMLIVFLQGDVYDGYLWFSSVEKVKSGGTVAGR
jgi:outer membrane protein assembly factor BamE (lipoprotein component of BamABCDE complex)